MQWSACFVQSQFVHFLMAFILHKAKDFCICALKIQRHFRFVVACGDLCLSSTTPWSLYELHVLNSHQSLMGVGVDFMAPTHTHTRTYFSVCLSSTNFGSVIVQIILHFLESLY